MGSSAPQASNPFPARAIATVDGRVGTGGHVPTTDGRPSVTLPLAATARMERLVSDYLSARGTRGCGAVLLGAHGSGKTHAVRDLMARAWAPDGIRPDAIPAHQISVQVEGPDFLALHRQILARVPAAELRDMSLRLLGACAARATFPGVEEAERRRRLEERLRADPGRIYDELRSGRISGGAAQDLQTALVEGVTGGSRDFARAMSFTLDNELGDSAYLWLAGRAVPTGELRRLGVSGPITSPEEAKHAIQLLVTLFEHAGRPLIVYLDQVERLVDPMRPGSRDGLLQSLAEFIPDHGAMLVLAGSRDAWEAFGPHLQERFGLQVIELPPLAADEAAALLRLHLEGSGVLFTPRASLELSSRAGGNVRRLLELAWKVMEERGDAECVTDELVTAALRDVPPYRHQGLALLPGRAELADRAHGPSLALAVRGLLDTAPGLVDRMFEARPTPDTGHQ